MILSYNELIKLIPDVINAEPENVNPASIDIRISGNYAVERRYCSSVDLVNKVMPAMEEKSGDEFVIFPGEFVLLESIEVFNLPDDLSCVFFLKSSVARAGLECLHSGWCDAGWNGANFTMAVKNMLKFGSIKLTAGMKIGQMVFYPHELVPKDKSYAKVGRYNNAGLSQSKGV